MAGSPKKRAKREAEAAAEAARLAAIEADAAEFEQIEAERLAEQEKEEVQIELTPETQREFWNEVWGVELGDSDCEQLDAQYARLSADYKGGVSQRTEGALRAICKCFRLRDLAMSGEYPDSAKAKQWQETADKIMASEALKANDSKPLEAVRVDKIVQWLEEKGGVRDGYLKSKAEVLRAINNTRLKVSPCVDIIDSMMLCVYNAGRVARGVNEFAEIPQNLIPDDPNGELAEKSTAAEREKLLRAGVIAPKRKNANRKNANLD